VINAILLIYQRNWVALIWEIGCAFFLFTTYKIQELNEYIIGILHAQNNRFNELIGKDHELELSRAEKIAECCRVNCERALRKMMMLKNLNKSLFLKIEELTEINLKQADTIKKLRRKNNATE
jgi:hypothetical protein